MTVMSLRPHQLFIFVALLSLISLDVYAAGSKETNSIPNSGNILSVFEDEIQQCEPVQKLSLLKETLGAQQSPIMRTVFTWLFPFGPAWNSILGTFYISSVPNFILAFIPAEINANTLNTMTAFATGGLLSDVFLHLVPHSFMGESTSPGVHFVMVEEKRNILVGLGIFLGFAAFFFMEKTLRVLGGDEDDSGHAHSHSHSHVEPQVTKTSGASGSTTQNGLRSRNSDTSEVNGSTIEQHEEPKSTNGPSKLSAYLNLFGDFVHNITDGLAMAASFYASPLIGATTTLACFAHEIPHEIADYSILIRSGFTKKQAMQSQFLTAVGAFVSSRFTFIGIAVHNATATNTVFDMVDLAAGVRQDAAGLLGTTLQLSDLVIPFVAGGFLYIGAVAVLPTLLAESKSAKQAMREFAAMAFGVVCMLLVAWNE
ncbi:ZIP zinc transporter-domain-containing protein [Gymnopilus junonius]|uniref:ZIP zinc transporter-domain-containing protein n=1 Tax=Gymnopilus junonius TaxID=109634 RepID=A0A9P5NY48_GYMJU|nr:ZIP zinc transporter-domain-containing protein [Gymnopilus junonius]